MATATQNSIARATPAEIEQFSALYVKMFAGMPVRVIVSLDLGSVTVHPRRREIDVYADVELTKKVTTIRRDEVNFTIVDWPEQNSKFEVVIPIHWKKGATAYVRWLDTLEAEPPPSAIEFLPILRTGVVNDEARGKRSLAEPKWPGPMYVKLLTPGETITVYAEKNGFYQVAPNEWVPKRMITIKQ